MGLHRVTHGISQHQTKILGKLGRAFHGQETSFRSSRQHGRPSTGHRRRVLGQPHTRSRPPGDRPLHSRASSRRHCQIWTLERRNSRVLGRHPRRARKRRTLGSDKPHQPTRSALTSGLPNRSCNTDSRLCNPIPVRRHNRQRSVPTTLAQNPRVPHPAKNHAPIPPTPRISSQGSEKGGLGD